jgi:hypothetical protein
MKTTFAPQSFARKAALGVAAVSLIGFGGPAQADLKIVDQITNTGRNGDQTQTVTAYFHGDALRLENDKGAVTLIDAAAGKAYNIDAATKTYNERPLPPRPQGPPPGDGASTLTLSASGATSSIAGASATKYTLSGTAPAGPPPGGGAPGPQGGQGGPGGPGGQDNGQPGPPPNGGGGGGQSATIAGDYWLTADLASAVGSTATLRPYLDIVAGPIGPLGADTLLAKLSSGSLFPLSATVSATSTTPDGQTRTRKATVVAQSVSKDALDASLFSVPSDYTKVNRPIPGVGRPQRPQRAQNEQLPPPPAQ